MFYVKAHFPTRVAQLIISALPRHDYIFKMDGLRSDIGRATPLLSTPCCVIPFVQLRDVKSIIIK